MSVESKSTVVLCWVQDDAVVAEEVDQLQRESEMPLEDFLDAIPPDYLEQREALPAAGSDSESELDSSERDSTDESSPSSSDESMSSSGEEEKEASPPPMVLRRSRRGAQAVVAVTHTPTVAHGHQPAKDVTPSADVAALLGGTAQEDGE